MYETYDDLLNERIKSAFEFTKDHINYIVSQISRMTAEKKQKEDTTMQVSYNGFTGELVKLEKTGEAICDPSYKKYPVYALSIYDGEKKVTHSFSAVKMLDMKFLDGVVTFGG